MHILCIMHIHTLHAQYSNIGYNLVVVSVHISASTGPHRGTIIVTL